MLQKAFQRPRTIDRVVGGFGNKISGSGRQLQAQSAFGQSLSQFFDQQQDNLPNILSAERFEDDYVIDPVEKFRSETAP